MNQRAPHLPHKVHPMCTTFSLKNANFCRTKSLSPSIATFPIGLHPYRGNSPSNSFHMHSSHVHFRYSSSSPFVSRPPPPPEASSTPCFRALRFFAYLHKLRPPRSPSSSPRRQRIGAATPLPLPLPLPASRPLICCPIPSSAPRLPSPSPSASPADVD
jgi:hypothetical protein